MDLESVQPPENRTMYPKNWRALRPGHLEAQGQALHVNILDLAPQPIPTGRLVIKDSMGFGPTSQRVIRTIPGSSELKATILEQGESKMLAYLSLIFSKEEVHSFHDLTPTFDGELLSNMSSSKKGGFTNRTSYAMMIDEQLLKEGLPLDDDHCYSMLCHWQNTLSDHPTEWEGARLTLPGERGEEALTFFKTRRITGQTLLWQESNEEGFPLRIHVDLGLMERVFSSDDQQG